MTCQQDDRAPGEDDNPFRVLQGTGLPAQSDKAAEEANVNP